MHGARGDVRRAPRGIAMSLAGDNILAFFFFSFKIFVPHFSDDPLSIHYRVWTRSRFETQH